MEGSHLSRRRLLTLLGSGLAAAVVSPSLRAAVGNAGLQTALATGRALGSELTLTVLHADHAVAQRAANDALAQLQRLDALLSIYRPDSQVAMLNREGSIKNPHPDFLAILSDAAAISEKSAGAFDVTVQPLWKLFADAKATGRLPDKAAIDAARAKVDYRKLRSSPHAISFAEAGMSLTLNGIAQGFAADHAAAVLKSHGIEHALINTGEIAVVGDNQGKPWTAGIQHPRQSDAYLTLARLENRCLATSGDYATTFTDDRLHHHIFDPATGDSPLELSSVSIAAPTACLADALSTAVFVLGSRRGLDLLQHYDNVDALLVCKDGKQLATAGFPRIS